MCLDSPAYSTEQSHLLVLCDSHNYQSELETLERRWRRRLEMQQRESAKKAAASAAVAASSGRALVPCADITEGTQQSNPVAQTAVWLDRAKSALKDPPEEITVEATDFLHHQIEEVQRLIHEGPSIQQTSADLPQVLDEETQAAIGDGVDAGGSEVEPADKRLRTAEDAEALVGFLRRVRASAASGEEF